MLTSWSLGLLSISKHVCQLWLCKSQHWDKTCIQGEFCACELVGGWGVSIGLFFTGKELEFQHNSSLCISRNEFLKKIHTRTDRSSKSIHAFYIYKSITDQLTMKIVVTCRTEELNNVFFSTFLVIWSGQTVPKDNISNKSNNNQHLFLLVRKKKIRYAISFWSFMWILTLYHHHVTCSTCSRFLHLVPLYLTSFPHFFSASSRTSTSLSDSIQTSFLGRSISNFTSESTENKEAFCLMKKPQHQKVQRPSPGTGLYKDKIHQKTF